MPAEFHDNLQGCVGLCFVDDTQNIRNVDSTFHQSIRWLGAQFHLLLTATPVPWGIQGYGGLLALMRDQSSIKRRWKFSSPTSWKIRTVLTLTHTTRGSLRYTRPLGVRRLRTALKMYDHGIAPIKDKLWIHDHSTKRRCINGNVLRRMTLGTLCSLLLFAYSSFDINGNPVI